MEINLHNNNQEVVAKTIVNYEDYENVSKYKWWLTQGGYAQSIIDKKSIRLHQFILGKHIDNQYVIDHINNDKLDNRRINLRFCSKQLNAHNRKKNIINSSIYKGVRIKNNRQSCSWVANYGSKHLGAFKSEKEAVNAYDTYCYQLFGDDAVMNLNYTQEEKEIMKTKIIGKKIRELPIGVSFCKIKQKYEVKFNCKFLGYTNSIKDATELYNCTKDKFINDKEKNRLSLIITRNTDNIPVIIMNNRKNEIKHILVDDDNWHDLMQSKWTNNSGYAIGTINGIQVRMHRYIMNINDPNICIDHINGNKLDNRKINLRIITQECNNFNRIPINKNTALKSYSKYKGVHKRTNDSFYSTIMKNGKTIYLGTYKNEIEAAIAYDKAALELFNEYAWLNSKHFNMFSTDDYNLNTGEMS
jgi:hypothetical protein